MTWARLDDQFPENPKVMDLHDRAFRLYVTALCYSARNLTDGVLSATAVRVVSAIVHRGNTKRWVLELVEAGLWVPLPDGAYRINDFLEYNPSRAETEERREKRASAGAEGGKRSGEVRRSKKEASASLESKQVLRTSGEPPAPAPSVVKPNSRTRGAQPVSRIDHEASEAGYSTVRLLNAMRAEHVDDGTRKVLLSRTRGLAPFEIENVREQMLAQRATIKHDAKWAVKRLRTLTEERSAA